MNYPKLIGLGGYLRSGKDTVADHLVAEHGYTKMGMSDPLLEALLTLDPLVPAMSEHGAAIATRKGTSLAPFVRASELFEAVDQDYTEFKTNSEVRFLLQKLGTEVGRKMIDEELWVKLASKNIAKVLLDGGRVVITGMRFPNELEMIRNLAGTNIWISRAGSEAPVTKHASENSVTDRDFNMVFYNNGTLDELYESVDSLLEGIRG